MITRDRPELTEQCIRSMRENAADWSKHRLVVVLDCTGDEVRAVLGTGAPADLKRREIFGAESVIVTGKQLGVGGAKNYGAQWFVRQFDHEVGHTPGPDSLIMFSDNDMFYLPGWDRTLEVCVDAYINHNLKVTQLGGWWHPFHGMKQTWHQRNPVTHKPDESGIAEVDAVTGNCFVMRWADWLKYGPFDSNAIGPGQSEDYALSQRVKAGGGLVATLDPPVAIHCGLVNSIGEPATGWREMEEMITGQLATLSAEMRDSVLIMRPAPELPQVSSALQTEQMLGKLTSRSRDQSRQRLTEAMARMRAHPGAEVTQAFEDARARLDMQPRTQREADIVRKRRLHGVNIGSGQRRFESVPAVYWQNVDLVSRPPDQVPDIVGDARMLDTIFVPGSKDYVVSHHLHEHLGHGEADPITRAAYKVLRAGGSLLVFTPDARKLAGRWLGGELDDFQFAVQMMGAYQGEESDRHKWLYTQQTLEQSLADAAPWREVKPFDWRTIPGADLARDWYIAAVECVK
jgi:predicted SAM-dependent methyltransferase